MSLLSCKLSNDVMVVRLLLLNKGEGEIVFGLGRWESFLSIRLAGIIEFVNAVVVVF